METKRTPICSIGTFIVCDDGAVYEGTDYTTFRWVEVEPVPGSKRAAELDKNPEAD